MHNINEYINNLLDSCEENKETNDINSNDINKYINDILDDKIDYLNIDKHINNLLDNVEYE